MGLELKRRSKQFLKKIPNARDIDEQEAFEVFGLRELPSFLGEGKNSFRIRPQLSRDIIPNTKIEIEVLDSNGNPVYWEVPSYKDDDKSQVISIWVYNDNNDKYNTPDGVCEIILVASTTRGPIRGTLKLNVVKNKQSASDIIFVDLPRGSVSASVESFNELPQGNGELTRTIQAGQFTYKKSIYGDDVSFETSTAIINGEMISGSLELDLSSTTLFPRLGGSQSQPTSVTASITEIVSNKIFRVSLPITASDNRSDGSIHTYEYSNDTITGNIKYLSTGSLNTTQNQSAIANITLTNVNPTLGRVHSVSTLIKSQGLPNSDFELIANTSVPNETDISYKISIPTEQLNDPKTIKIQFLNINGDVSSTEVIVEDVIFEGGNVYIGGSQSLVTGSMFISNAIGSGLEIGGHSSGFMKSVGYEGQISASEGKGPGGFIIYSGSNALQMGADVLQGVGMQFVGDNDDRHLIFTTADGGILDVKTDKFFIGTTNTQFISGSDSNIEISSSLFHLDPKNDRLVIGADAIIEADLTANNIRTPATINGAQSTDLNASSSITQDGFAKFVSASIAGFTVNTEEIKSSDDSLRLKSNGQMTGSAILLGDKVGGNFVQFADSTLTVRGDLAVDQITTPSTIGGSPSNLTNASASITADGFAKFVSASIGGWDITTGSIEGGNLIMKPEGILQTKDYASGVKGWKISSELNGYAEFENVKIRGTLATTTFEKESVNAVGGQLYVANSTTLSGSFSSSINPVSSTGVTSSTSLPSQFGDNSTDKIEFPLSTPYQLVSVEDSTKFTIDTPIFADGGTAYLYYSSSNSFSSQISASTLSSSITAQNNSASIDTEGQYPAADSHSIFNFGRFNNIIGFTDISDYDNNVVFISEQNGANIFSVNNVLGSTTLGVVDAGNLQIDIYPNRIGADISEEFPANLYISTSSITSTTTHIASELVKKNAGIWPTSITVDGKITFNDGGGSHTFDILERIDNTTLRIDTSSNKPNTSGSNVVATGQYSQSLSDTRTISAGAFTTTEFIYTDISPTASVFIADNVTGFANGEILTLKKVTNTGFATEYVKVDSTERRAGSSDSDLSGYLTVTRSYGSGTTGDSASLGDIASVGQSYEEGQVIVSTGKIGSGFIRLNANPNDPSTPYMDIVERTGSGLYDIELKARLGDLSGLANSDLVHGRSNPGFGLATDNVYLQGGIIATFGEIGGFGINATTISSSNNNLILKDNGQITGSQVLFDGGKISGSGIIIDVEDFSLDSTNFKVTTTGDITASNALLDGGTIGGFELGSNIISSSNGNLILNANGDITASSVKLEGDITANTGRFDDITVAGIISQDDSDDYILESWITSSAFISSSYQYGGSLVNAGTIGKTFKHGVLTWTVDSGSDVTYDPFIGQVVSASKYTKATSGDTQATSPPTFKRWADIKGFGGVLGSGIPYGYPDEYVTPSTVENIIFPFPNYTGLSTEGPTYSFSITSNTISLPSTLISTSVLNALVLQTAVRFGPSFGGFSPTFRVEILKPGGALIKQFDVSSRNAGEWLPISLPITDALITVGGTNVTIQDEFKIKLSWFRQSGTSGGGSIKDVRIGELRILKAASSEGLFAKGIQFEQSSLLPTKYGTAHFGNIVPGKDDTFDLGQIANVNTGTPNQRWDDIYATNGTIQTSDETQKTNITSSDLGLSFVNELRPVSYNWINKTRTHYGLIAQEVSSSLDTFGKTTNDFAGITTGSLMGLRYHELISPMIKAIQELSDEVNQLKLQLSQSQG